MILLILVLSYLILILPGKRKKETEKFFSQQKLYAHRGLYNNEGNAPENSMAAFHKAIRAGYGIELDVQLTRDRVPVVFHDDTLKRACNVPGRVDTYTYKQLREFTLFQSNQRIPRLDEVLALVNGRVPLIIEHKIEPRHNLAVCRIVAKLLEKYNGPYCIESFHPMGVHWYKKHKPWVVRGQLSQAFYIRDKKYPLYMLPAYICLTHLLINFMGSPDFISYDCRDWWEPSTRICRRLYRCTAVAWTVKSEEQLEKIRPYFDVYIFEGFEPKMRKDEIA